MIKKVIFPLLSLLFVVFLMESCRTKYSSLQSSSEYRGAQTKIDPRKKIPFTEDLIDKYSITEELAKGLQFYLEGEITLSASNETQTTRAENGVLIIENKTQPLAGYIRNGTPGVIQQESDNKISINFQQQGNLTVLQFERKEDGYFRLRGEPVGDGRLRVSVENRSYIADIASTKAYLVIQADWIKTVDPQKWEASGARIGEGSSSSGSGSGSSTGGGVFKTTPSTPGSTNGGVWQNNNNTTPQNTGSGNTGSSGGVFKTPSSNSGSSGGVPKNKVFGE